MKINKENYPAYFLDYHEGRLPEAGRVALFDFLGKHPELKEEFDAFQAVALPMDEPVVFAGKGALRRGVITAENHDWYFAAYAEGDLSQEERKAVEAFAAGDPAMQRELLLMQKVFLPGEAIAFPGKVSLKRHVIASVATSAGAPVAMPVATSAGAPVATPAAMAAEGGATGEGMTVTRSTAAGKASQARGKGVIIPLFVKRVIPYASVAAVLTILAGLFFLRAPEQSSYHLTRTQQIPVVGEVDDPVAVADIPPLQQEPEKEVAPGPRASGITGQQRGVSTVAEGRGREAEDPARQRTGVASLLAGSLPQPAPVDGRRSIKNHLAAASRGTENIEHRTEFAYWTPASLPDETFFENQYTDEEYGYGSRELNLVQFAMHRIGQNLPVDFSKADERIRENRSPVLALAEAGLRGLGGLVSNTLGIEHETDEEGRLLAISAGEGFEVRRSSNR